MLQLQEADNWEKPAATTWAAEFLLGEGESREFLGSWINSSGVHEAKKRRAKRVITCSFPCGKWLHMIGARASPQDSDRRQDQRHIALSRVLISLLRGLMEPKSRVELLHFEDRRQVFVFGRHGSLQDTDRRPLHWVRVKFQDSCRQERRQVCAERTHFGIHGLLVVDQGSY